MDSYWEILEKSLSKLIQVAGRIQFHEDVGLRSVLFLWLLFSGSRGSLLPSPKPAMVGQVLPMLSISLTSLSAASLTPATALEAFKSYVITLSLHG